MYSRHSTKRHFVLQHERKENRGIEIINANLLKNQQDLEQWNQRWFRDLAKELFPDRFFFSCFLSLF